MLLYIEEEQKVIPGEVLQIPLREEILIVLLILILETLVWMLERRIEVILEPMAVEQVVIPKRSLDLIQEVWVPQVELQRENLFLREVEKIQV